MDETATIFTYTVVRVAPPSHQERVPYCVAVLEGDDGQRFTAFVDGYTDGDEVTIGQRVHRGTTADDLPHYHF